MTIKAWIFLAVIVVIGGGIAAFAFWYAWDAESLPAKITGIAMIVLTILICGLFIWWRSNSASGRRAMKDQESNLGGGLIREVRVYDINGDLIETYSGKFDIETDRENYILFDDENGKRHIIYFTTGTVIVDEK